MIKWIFCFLLCLNCSLIASQLSLSEQKKASAKIDALVLKGLKSQNIQANPDISDEVFLRRVYLDIAGRIPTFREIEQFKSLPKSTRRTKTIDQLFDSSAYVSHSFNFWADTLRATSFMKKANGNNYLEWIKESIATNKPYDVFVKEMITAEGALFKPGNGATGYYMRDFRMPLDNIANTMQTFLATSMVCAQCHDHPYKEWTQREFYELAAFTHGTETNAKGVDQNILKKISKSKSKKDVKKANKLKELRPFYQGIYNSGTGKIVLPDDFEGEDGVPKETVHAKVPFGPEVKINYNSSNGAKKRKYKFRFDRKGFAKNVNSRKALADWITSPDNPMFTKTIVNRLWDRVFGVPLVGKLNDMREKDMGVNPELSQYLTTLMKDIGYDQKLFMKVLFNTQAYQRDTTQEFDKKYYFQGPVMKRLSAEQIWDSLLSLRSNKPDQSSEQPVVILDSVLYEEISKKVNNPQQLMEFVNNSKSFSKKMMRKVGGDKMLKRRKRRGDSNRASEWSSPANVGSMLQAFGQSSREQISGASEEASIPQALNLMNNRLYRFDNSQLSKVLEKLPSQEEKIKQLYQAVLCREAKSHELKIMSKHMRAGLNIEDAFWALINTHEFKMRL